MTPRANKAKDIARSTWRFLKTGSLKAADGIIALSLLRKGARPKPGTRTAWPRGRRQELYRDQKGLCMYCRTRLTLGASHIDHVTPVNQAGTNDRENLQLLCPGCNLRKSDRSDAEFRYRYRTLLPREHGKMPERRIRQSEFRAITTASPDADSYKRFKAGEYLTSTQKVNSGALATGAIIGLAIFVPINMAAAPGDASVLLIVSLAMGAAAGLGVRLRARYTGKDQED